MPRGRSRNRTPRANNTTSGSASRRSRRQNNQPPEIQSQGSNSIRATARLRSKSGRNGARSQDGRNGRKIYAGRSSSASNPSAQPAQSLASRPNSLPSQNSTNGQNNATNNSGESVEEEERYCYCDRKYDSLKNHRDLHMIACGGESCNRWFHTECIHWKPDDNDEWLVASFNDKKGRPVKVKLESASQESAPTEKFYCLPCWEETKREKHQAEPQAPFNSLELLEMNKRLGFHGEFLKKKKDLLDYVRQLREIIDDDDLVDKLLNSSPRPYPTIGPMSRAMRETLAIQGRSFEILQLCVSIGKCDCCGKVEPYASDPKLQARKKAFSNNTIEQRVLRAGGPSLFHHRHLNGKYHDAFKCTCQEVCNGGQFYAFQRKLQVEKFCDLHPGQRFPKSIQDVENNENKASICHDCYSELAKKDDSMKIARKFSYRNGFGNFDPPPLQPPDEFDPKSTNVDHIHTPEGEKELHYVLNNLTAAEEKAIAPVIPLVSIARLRHGNIKRKGDVTCIRRKSSIQKILPNLPKECNTVVFEYKANSTNGMKSFQCRRYMIQRALILLKATGVDLWKNIIIDTNKLNEWPVDGNLLDEVERVEAKENGNAAAAASTSRANEADEELGPAPAQNEEEEEGYHGHLAPESDVTVAQVIEQNERVLEEEFGYERQSFQVNERVYYRRDGETKVGKIVTASPPHYEIQIENDGGDIIQADALQLERVSRTGDEHQDGDDNSDDAPRPVRNDATSATFRQDDVFSRQGNIVKMDHDKYSWSMAFPTLFPPRRMDDGSYEIFGDITAHPQRSLGIKDQSVSLKEWLKWMVWRSDGAPAAHPTFALVGHGEYFQKSLHGQSRAMIHKEGIPKGMTFQEFQSAVGSKKRGGRTSNRNRRSNSGAANADNRRQGGLWSRLNAARPAANDDDDDEPESATANAQDDASGSNSNRDEGGAPHGNVPSKRSLLSQISIWSQNVVGTDQYWNGQRLNFKSAAHFHSYLKKKELRYFITGSQAEFHDPFLRRVLAKYAQVVTGDDALYQAILSPEGDAFSKAVSRYKNVVTHFFAYKNEMWISTLLKNGFGLVDLIGVYEFAKGRGAIHTHFAVWAIHFADDEIDKTLSELAFKIYEAYMELEKTMDSLQLAPWQDPRNAKGPPKDVMNSIRDVLQQNPRGTMALDTFDAAILEYEETAAKTLASIQRLHFGLSAYHIGCSPEERIEPGGRRNSGYRERDAGHAKKSTLRETKPLRKFKFEQELNLYCRCVGIQNYCFDHQCNDYCLRYTDRKILAKPEEHGTATSPKDDPNIIRWFPADARGKVYITYRYWECRMGFGAPLKFPRKGNRTGGINPQVEVDRLEYDKNGNMALQAIRNHPRVLQEPVAVFHWGANADIKRLYINQGLVEMLAEKGIDPKHFMQVVAQLGRSGLDLHMSAGMIVDYITSYQCKGRESSAAFKKTLELLWDDYWDNKQEKTLASYAGAAMRKIAKGSDFSKDEALFCLAGGQLTFNSRKVRAIHLNVLSVDDLRARDDESNPSGVSGPSGKQKKSFTEEALVKKYEKRKENLNWNLYEFCSNEIEEGCNGVPNFKGTAAQFDAKWPMSEEFALTHLRLYKPYVGSYESGVLKRYTDDNDSEQEYGTYREALEDFMDNEKFPHSIRSKLLRSQLKIQFSKDAGHEYGAPTDGLSPNEDRDLSVNDDAFAAAESDDDEDHHDQYDDDENCLFENLDLSTFPSGRHINWKDGYDPAAKDWLKNYRDDFYKEFYGAKSSNFEPLDPEVCRPENARGFHQNLLVALALMARLDDDVMPLMNVMVQGNPGSGKTMVQKMVLNSIRLLSDEDQNAAASIAPTGCAASLTNGSTAHRFACIPTTAKAYRDISKTLPTMNTEQLRAKAKMMLLLFLLSLDEFSMLGRADFAHMNHYITLMRKHGLGAEAEMRFGGIPYIQVFGDASQLQAVLKKTFFDDAPANPGQRACAAGKLEVQDFIDARDPGVESVCVVMTDVQRQKNPRAKATLLRVRNGEMNEDAADHIVERGLTGLPTEEQNEFQTNALYLMQTWKQTEPITIRYMRQLGHPLVITKADVTNTKPSHVAKINNLRLKNVLMMDAQVMLIKNVIPENEHHLYNGSVGRIRFFGYPHEDGPYHCDLPDYVLVEFHKTVLSRGPYVPDNPSIVPIRVEEFKCEHGCCIVRQIPLIMYKASSVHKAQGMTIGPGEFFEKVVVGLGGSSAMAGLDNVALSRAKDFSDMAIYDVDKPLTRLELLNIGKGRKYSKQRNFEAKLKRREAESVPRWMKKIMDCDDGVFAVDPDAPKTFAGGVNALYHRYNSAIEGHNEMFAREDYIHGVHSLVDLRALGQSTNAFLDKIREVLNMYEDLRLPEYFDSLYDPLLYKHYIDLPRQKGFSPPKYHHFNATSFVGKEIKSHRYYTFTDDFADFRLPFVASNDDRFFLPAFASETRRAKEGMPTERTRFFYAIPFFSPAPRGDEESDWFRPAIAIDLLAVKFRVSTVYNGCIYLEFFSDKAEANHLGWLTNYETKAVMLPLRYIQSYQCSSKFIRRRMFELLMRWTAIRNQDPLRDLFIQLFAPRKRLVLMSDVTNGWNPTQPIVSAIDYHVAQLCPDVLGRREDFDLNLQRTMDPYMEAYYQNRFQLAVDDLPSQRVENWPIALDYIEPDEELLLIGVNPSYLTIEVKSIRCRLPWENIKGHISDLTVSQVNELQRHLDNGSIEDNIPNLFEYLFPDNVFVFLKDHQPSIHLQNISSGVSPDASLGIPEFNIASSRLREIDGSPRFNPDTGDFYRKRDTLVDFNVEDFEINDYNEHYIIVTVKGTAYHLPWTYCHNYEFGVGELHGTDFVQRTLERFAKIEEDGGDLDGNEEVFDLLFGYGRLNKMSSTEPVISSLEFHIQTLKVSRQSQVDPIDPTAGADPQPIRIQKVGKRVMFSSFQEFVPRKKRRVDNPVPIRRRKIIRWGGAKVH